MSLELTITQYLDGTLSGPERLALERRLDTDDEARALLEEHRKLDMLLKGMPLPDVRWDALAEHLSSAVADAEMPVEEPAPSLRLPWARGMLTVALAASMLLAVGLTIRMAGHGGSGTGVIHPNPVNASDAVAIVDGPQMEVAAGASELQITVGTGQSSADGSMLSHYSDDVLSRPSHVTVASGVAADQDAPTELQ